MMMHKSDDEHDAFSFIAERNNLKMFLAKTNHSGKFKALFEVLFQNMTTACFTITENKMALEARTTQNVLISVNLPATCFEEYIFNETEPIHIGLGSHINQFFKSVKNKSTITFTMSKPFIFDIEIGSPIDDYVVSLSAVIESMQNIAPTIHEKYNSKAIPVSGTNFNQICKAFKSPILNITKKNGQLQFSFEVSGISTKTLSFGKKNLQDTNLFHQAFHSDQFSRIGKISSFVSEPIMIFAEGNKSLFLNCVSDIGTMKVFMLPV